MADASSSLLANLCPGSVCAPLEAQLRVGCPCAGSGEVAQVDPQLFAAFAAAPDHIAGVKRWIADTCGGELADTVAVVVTEWLKFVHFGCLEVASPAWLLAWAGHPYNAADVALLETSPSLQVWLRRWHAGVSLCDICPVTLSDPIVRHVQAWLRDMSAEVLPWEAWYCEGGREAAFAALAAWLGGGYRVNPYLIERMQELQNVQRVPLVDLLAAEARVWGRLPFDLRRVLLEIGNVMPVLFGCDSSLMHWSKLPETEGPWLWDNARVGFSYKTDKIVRKLRTRLLELGLQDHGSVFQGSVSFGAGGGGYSTLLRLVMQGPCRGRVVVEDEDDEDCWWLVPLSDSLWRKPHADPFGKLPQKSGAAPHAVSDIVHAMFCAAGTRFEGAVAGRGSATTAGVGKADAVVHKCEHVNGVEDAVEPAAAPHRRGCGVSVVAAAAAAAAVVVVVVVVMLGRRP
jgi:hypothetical protein